MLTRIAKLAIAAPRRILVVAMLVMIGAGVFGLPVASHLSAGGFEDPSTQSARAADLLTEKFNATDQKLVITVTAPQGATSTRARNAATGIVDGLRASPHVLSVTSAWTEPAAAASGLVSRDGKTGLIVANLAGGENKAQKYAKQLADELVADQDGVTVRAGGSAMVYAEVNDQTERDLLRMESIAIPFIFIVLVWVFGGLLAAAVPLSVGVLAILGSLSVLRLIAHITDVSIYSLNVTTALGLALAIDYTLLIINRYREELARGFDRDVALIRTVSTAGRTVLFSAITVALSMSTMALFPTYYLRSLAYAGVAVVAFAAVSAILVAPAAIVLLGDRLNALDIRRGLRRVMRRPEPEQRPVKQLLWYRSTKFVMGRSLAIGMAVVALLLLVGSPFLGVRWGYLDDRVLPSSASSRQVGDELRNDFADDNSKAVRVVIPDANGLSRDQLGQYAAALSQVPDVVDVSAPSGTYVGGRMIGPPAAPTGIAAGSAFITVNSNAPLFSPASHTQLDALHAVSTPDARTVEFGGLAQVHRDTVDSVMSRLPWVLGLIAVGTFALLFLLTGSLVLPVKAIILNVLSLTATFGTLVWIFQDGNLGALGTTSTGTLVAILPILLFCIAFGLSMDYEVFLISRIREYWLKLSKNQSGLTSREANNESVALGLAYTGRVVTAAALIMAITFGALAAAEVSFIRMFGLGLAIAVIVDATVVRMVLVPAFMHLMGEWNWWAPAPLARLHQRFGISESAPEREIQQPNRSQRTTTK